MRTLQPISGIPRIGEWRAHKKDKLYGELNLAPILWNVSTYFSSAYQKAKHAFVSRQVNRMAFDTHFFNPSDKQKGLVILL